MRDEQDDGEGDGGKAVGSAYSQDCGEQSADKDARAIDNPGCLEIGCYHRAYGGAQSRSNEALPGQG